MGGSLSVRHVHFVSADMKEPLDSTVVPRCFEQHVSPDNYDEADSGMRWGGHDIEKGKAHVQLMQEV